MGDRCSRIVCAIFLTFVASQKLFQNYKLETGGRGSKRKKPTKCGRESGETEEVVPNIEWKMGMFFFPQLLLPFEVCPWGGSSIR